MKNDSMLRIIQGGMGVNISSWNLAKTVSMLNQRGTVSGVALERVLVRGLRMGDSGGHWRRALDAFPFPHIAEEVVSMFYVENGHEEKTSLKGIPVWSVIPSRLLISLTVCANFATVWLAKEGHENPVNINYLEKIAIPHVFAITGAMLAGVDGITMGAGIPLQIPGLIDSIVENREVSYRTPVIGENIKSHTMTFNPEEFFGGKIGEVKRPDFLPIISSNLLATVLTKKLPKGSVNGFVIEEPTAGGHNAPPRKTAFNESNEPIYGEKDKVDYEKIVNIALPFWIGGANASPEKLEWARSVGATGIQAGSIFALSRESGMDPKIRMQICKLGFEGKLKIVTDALVSPTGFPFKVVVLPKTISEKSVYESRKRICDQGFLTSLYEKGDGSIGSRCPSEPVNSFVAKGGKIEDTVSRGCVCNGLMATAGLRNDEPALVTLGDDSSFLKKIMSDSKSSYGAKDAIEYLLS